MVMYKLGIDIGSTTIKMALIKVESQESKVKSQKSIVESRKSKARRR